MSFPKSLRQLVKVVAAFFSTSLTTRQKMRTTIDQLTSLSEDIECVESHDENVEYLRTSTDKPSSFLYQWQWSCYIPPDDVVHFGLSVVSHKSICSDYNTSGSYDIDVTAIIFFAHEMHSFW